MPTTLLARPCGLPLALLAALLPGPALAQQSWGGIFSFVSLTTDYRYHGVSSSDGHPALQANAHWWRPDGFYAGLFATTVDFDDPGRTSYELDLYGGKTFDLKDRKTQLKLEAMFTAFPNEHVYGPTYSFVQFKAGARRKEGPVTLNAGVSFVPEASYGSGEAWLVEGKGAYQARPDLALNAELGRRWIERGEDRTFWSLGARAAWKAGALEVRYVDTDLSRAECGGTDRCEATLVGTVTLDLPPVM